MLAPLVVLCCCSCQREQPARRPCHLLPLWGVRAISIFYQFIQFLGTAEIAANGGERGCLSSSPLHLFADSAKHPAGQPWRRPPLSAQLVRSVCRPPCSRGGRPVSAGAIGKQRQKMCFPVSFPSLTSKHSNRSRKNVAGPQFLLTIIFIATVPRPPPRKFDKSQNL